MSEIFNIERNDECICGSGKKYKKCCLPKVEKIEVSLIKALEKTCALSPEGKEFIRIISVMYGIDLGDDEAEPNVERLADLLVQTWDEEEQVFKKKPEEFLNKIVNILRGKKSLKYVRIPGFMLVDIDFEKDDIEIKSAMEEIIESLSPEEYLLDLAYSLRVDKYNEEEIKVIFQWISFGLLGGFSHGFMLPILQASFKDINEAKSKLEEKIGDKDELSKDDIAEFFKINAEYPVFEEYYGTTKLMDVQEDLDDVLDGKISFKFPFYIMYAFYIKFFATTMGMVFKTLSGRGLNEGCVNELFGVLDEFLREKIIYEKVFDCIYDTIEEAEEKAKDEDFKNKLKKIKDFFSILTSVHFHVFKGIFLDSWHAYFDSLPQRLDDSEIVLESIDQITDRKFFDRYVSYLESKGLKEEAEYLKELYGEVENNKSKIIEKGLSREIVKRSRLLKRLSREVCQSNASDNKNF